MKKGGQPLAVVDQPELTAPPQLTIESLDVSDEDDECDEEGDEMASEDGGEKEQETSEGQGAVVGAGLGFSRSVSKRGCKKIHKPKSSWEFGDF